MSKNDYFDSHGRHTDVDAARGAADEFYDTIFGPFYLPDDRDREIFGDRYQPPEKFEHGKEYLVAQYEKDPDNGDGNPVEIYESRWPARSFKLIALDSTNSLGELIPGGVLSTGSGDEVGRLMVTLAQEIVRGMVSFR